jgi:hypothetical protein
MPLNCKAGHLANLAFAFLLPVYGGCWIDLHCGRGDRTIGDPSTEGKGSFAGKSPASIQSKKILLLFSVIQDFRLA